MIKSFHKNKKVTSFHKNKKIKSEKKKPDNKPVIPEEPDEPIVPDVPEEPDEPVAPEEPSNPRMWYGLIPYDPEGKIGFNTPEQIGEQMTYDVIKFGLDCCKLTETDPAPLPTEGVNMFIDTDYAYCFICVIVPEDSNLVAYMNDGIGGRCEFSKFDNVSGWAQDGCILVNEINGVKYKLYGMYETSGGGNYGLFIDEK